jgi:hypothetical protein
MLKRILFSFSVMMGILVFNFHPVAAQQTVVGQNSSSIDVQTVQAAVDQGGTVLLKGTFDFGDRGRVNITKDVKLIGEVGLPGIPQTKMKGGFWAFHSPLPLTLRPETPGPAITIQNIHFDGALWAPVCIAYARGVTISGNKISNVKPYDSGEPIMGKPGLNRQNGIIFNSGYTQPIQTRKYIPNLLTGNFIIEDNDIDLANEVPTKTMAQGVYVQWTTGATVQILRNTIVNCARSSIDTVDNYLGQEGSGMIIIKDNKLITGIEGIPLPTPAYPNIMTIGWFFDVSGGSDPQRNFKHYVLNNAIRSRGKTSVGITAFTDGIVVVNNNILSEGAESLPLFIASSDGYVAYNRMEGESNRPAVLIRPWKPLKASKNVLISNDFSQFKGLSAEVVFEKDASNNFYSGIRCKISDNGSNNVIQISEK